MSKPKTFVRDATGLVREASSFDVFMYNEVGMNFAGSSLMGAMVGTIILGGDLFTGWLLSTILGVLIGLTYYLLAVTMPRSGADYVYNSRILHPAIGLVAAGFMGWLAPLINVGGGASGWVTYGLAPYLSVVSLTTNNPSLANLSVAVTSPLIVFVLGAITMAIFGIILGVTGLRKYFVIQNILVIFSLIAMAVMMVVSFTTSHSDFVAAFDAVAKGYGTSYSGIIAQATKAGWTATPRTPAQAFFLVPFVLSSIWWATQSASFSGETKSIRKSQLIGMLSAIVVMTTLYFVAWASLIVMVGYDFGNAMSYFAFNNPSAVTIPAILPMPTVFYYALASKNMVLMLIIALGAIIPLMQFIPWGILIFSRYLFAMSFDRLLPESVSKMNDRFHTPLNSVAIATVLSIVIMGLLSYLTSFPATGNLVWYTLGSVNVLIQIAAFISALALASLPYLRKELYEQSFPFKRKIVGIPIATWSGLITMGILVYSLGVWFLSPYSLIPFGGFPQIAYLCVAFGIILIFVYFGVNAYRKHQGIELALVFKQIPPE